MRYEHQPHFPLHHLPQHDPAAVDFRAFYPYTPNEVKHRRRTTSSQLKVLESVFRVDTKPNASLRNELASQLDMTARGVQVWFQNRRAKEKNKVNKVVKPHTNPSGADTGTPGPDAKEEDDTDTRSLASPSPGDDSSEEHSRSDSPRDIPTDHSAERDDSPQPPIPSLPPKLHVFTDSIPRPSSASSWQQHSSPTDTPPDSAIFPSRLSLADIHSQRRGSLPANAFFHPFSIHGLRSIDAWDPLARRRSVDTSLQRLVMNPYAQLARARNGALFGPRSPSQSQPPTRRSSRTTHPLPSRRSILPHSDMRRASMDSRALAPARADRLSPRPFHPIRASLPDTSLYGAARRYVPQIPGPLPEPGFTFGAASLNSPADEDSHSPSDLSSYSFPPKARDDTADDDDVMSTVSYETLSRFGSVVSIATSDSSVFSSTGYYDVGLCAGDPVPDLERRGSCGSTHGHFTASVTAELDGVGQAVSSPAPLTADGYFDDGPTRPALTSEVDSDPTQTDSVPSTSFSSSPASTASPDASPMSQSSTTTLTTVPVSIASELGLVFNNATGEGLLPTNGADCLKQQQRTEQQQTPTASQAIEKNPRETFMDTPDAPTAIALPTLAKTRPVTPADLSRDLRDENLPNISKVKMASAKDDSALATEHLATNIGPAGDFAAQYAELMDGFGFGVPLGALNNGAGRERRQGSGTGRDPIANLGIDPTIDEFAATVVASSSYGAALGVPPIGLGQAAFEVSYGP